MTKKAHITSRPDHQVGDKVVGICGKQWKVTTLWDDLPSDKPICRRCVDGALKALTEIDSVLQMARIRSTTALIMAGRLDEELNPDHLMLDGIAELDAAYRDEVEAKARAKADRKKARETCTCTWTLTGKNQAELTKVDPACPVHGRGDVDIEVEEKKAKGARGVEDVELPDPPKGTMINPKREGGE